MRARSGTRLACLFLAVPLALAVSCSSARSGESIGTTAQAELVDTFGLGAGRSGALNATVAGTVVNTYAPITAVTGASTVTVGPSQGAATPFGPGDLVLVWRTTGLSAVSTSQAPFNLIADVGGYELGRIKTVAGALITLTNPLGSMSRYTTGSQLVRVPEYTSASISASASIVPYAWDGSSGGIVVFLATGTVTNAGTISASGAGFRGGLLENATTATPAPHCTAHDGSDESASCGGAHKGEGLDPAAYSLPSMPSGMQPTSTYGNGNYANGGGGGEARNAGGGGGGSLGEGGSGGATSSTDGTRAVGGYGGAPVAYTGNSGFVSLGGGGGAGDEDHGSGTAGGAGGGVLLLRAAAFAGAGAFHADGASVVASATSDGAGGGGGAGAVLLFSTAGVSCAAISANGGAGGVGGSEPDGPGGGGGGGLVYIEALSTTGCTPSVTAGAAGTTGGIPDDATAGQLGQVSSQGLAFGQGSCTPEVLGNNQCGGCVSDSDCPTGEVCDTSTNRCGPCTASEQGSCSGTTSACSSDMCVACTGDFGSGTVAPCLSATAPKCVLTGAGAGTCGTCLSSADCTASTPACASDSFTCVACNGDQGTTATAACPSTASPYCQAAGTCGACTMDSDCTTGVHAGPRCDVMTGACGNTCASDAVCGSGQWCDDLMTMPGVCQAETANGQTVPGGTCTPALGARACVTGVCSTSDNECGLPNGASCGSDAGVHDPACRSGVCDQSGPSVGTCEGCASDSDCTGSTPACSSTGACVQCTEKNSFACTGDTPLCSVGTNACVACNGDLGTKATFTCTQPNAPFCSSSGACGNCMVSSDCTGPGHAGPICSPTDGSCGVACRSSADCSTAQWCTSADAGFGSCMAKIANGGPLPTTPSAYSTCTAAVGLLVCASGTCDAVDNRCGVAAVDAGATDAAPSMDAGVPVGVSLEGGALSCTARRGPASTGSSWLLGVGIALASLARRRR